jgi:small-conductance mechanosensitive channel
MFRGRERLIGTVRSPLLAGAALIAAAVAAPIALRGDSGPKTSIYKEDAVLGHLNASIHWYRQVGTAKQWITQPSDEFFYETQIGLAGKEVKLAFDTAAAQVPLTTATARPAAGPSKTNASEQRRSNNLKAGLAERLRVLDAEIKSVDAQIQSAQSDQDRANLAAQRNTLQAAYNLSLALRAAMQKVEEYVNNAADEGGASTISGQINALQLSVSDIFGGPPALAAAPTRPAAGGEPSGLIGRTLDLFRLGGALRGIDQLLTETGKMQAIVSRLREPLRASLSAIVAQSEQVGDRALGNDLSQLQTARQQLETMAADFNVLSAASVPLRGESAYLDQSLQNLGPWHDSVSRQYDAQLRGLIVRLAVVVATLALVLVISDIWRRMTFRYTVDARRRHQFLLIRRFVIGGLMMIVILVAIISDLGSLATFAGFMTAGVALALQSIILSLAAYFFLIGRHGIRVGDRVTVSGVTGEIIDTGLVRLYLMELAGSGVDLHPTGRVIVVPNSVIFQANPIFKQMPGTDFGWHEIAVTLNVEGDMAYARDKILAAVNQVCAEYQPLIETQHGKAESLVGMKLEAPHPAARLRLGDKGLEIIVRYPVPMGRADKIDEFIMNAVLEAIQGEPRLKDTVSGKPRTGPLGKV